MIEARHLRVLRAVAATGSFSAAARRARLHPARRQPADEGARSLRRHAAADPHGPRDAPHPGGRGPGAPRLRHPRRTHRRRGGGRRHRRAARGPGPPGLLPERQLHPRPHRPGRPAGCAPRHPGLPRRGRAAPLDRDAPRGDCDIALAFRYGAGRAEWDDLVVRPLLADRLVGLVPEGHRLAGSGPVGIGELAEESWIAGCPRCRRQLVDVCEEAGFTPASTSPPTTTRPWWAWWGRAWAWPSCRPSPSSPYGPGGADRGRGARRGAGDRGPDPAGPRAGPGGRRHAGRTDTRRHARVGTCAVSSRAWARWALLSSVLGSRSSSLGARPFLDYSKKRSFTWTPARSSVPWWGPS